MSNKKRSNNLSVFLASRAGRKFFHMTYSLGAAIVILGALAKITHLPFGNTLLFIGMITEACVFAISAFDTDQVDYEEESVQGGVAIIGSGSSEGGRVNANASEITIGGGVAAVGGIVGVAGNNLTSIGGVAYNPENLSPAYIENMDNAAKGMGEFSDVVKSLNEVSQSLLENYKKISESTQSASLSSESLNESVSQINNVFEAQIKSIADQMETVRYINSSLERIRHLYDNTIMDTNAFKIENERMARQIQELNKVYARLLQAMNAGAGYGGYNPGGYNPGGGYKPDL